MPGRFRVRIGHFCIIHKADMKRRKLRRTADAAADNDVRRKLAGMLRR